MAEQELKSTDIFTPSKSQPEVVYLAEAGHQIPVKGLSYFEVDKIAFDCPLHPPKYDEDGLPIEDPNTGEYVQGHKVVLFAHVGKPYSFKQELMKAKDGKPAVKRTVYIYGYSISGTTITILPQVVCRCTTLRQKSEELYQETCEEYYRQIYNEDFISEEPLIAPVRKTDPRRR